MTAYVIVDIEVVDPEGYEAYKKIAPATVDAFGGRYLARGGPSEVLEGDWRPHRLVILEFETSARAKEWLNSSDYAPARKERHRTARSNMVVVEGVARA
ncbi:MAG TPA: DUF1330 domain-containing protein [Anaerolineales bacterium]|nr:DUF1330 domain-containing protein [Anaerolineales bacterium]